jgi:hypothetical protein
MGDKATVQSKIKTIKTITDQQEQTTNSLTSSRTTNSLTSFQTCIPTLHIQPQPLALLYSPCFEDEESTIKRNVTRSGTHTQNHFIISSKTVAVVMRT